MLRSLVGSEMCIRDRLSDKQASLEADAQKREKDLTDKQAAFEADAQKREKELSDKQASLEADAQKREKELSDKQASLEADAQKREKDLTEKQAAFEADAQKREKELSDKQAALEADTQKREKELTAKLLEAQQASNAMISRQMQDAAEEAAVKLSIADDAAEMIIAEATRKLEDIEMKERLIKANAESEKEALETAYDAKVSAFETDQSAKLAELKKAEGVLRVKVQEFECLKSSYESSMGIREQAVARSEKTNTRRAELAKEDLLQQRRLLEREIVSREEALAEKEAHLKSDIEARELRVARREDEIASSEVCTREKAVRLSASDRFSSAA
eukprot:TRINITY_DN5934_c0_g2_i5.p1 TRINITY_DN5934_c0_g2~~TRINITY_DN5934_c0_g2_i5.p1  ORF type:complete len:373 (+),score=111.51 TRINITY_DN5934_c0_g2_i5:121-1119(+)